MFMNETDLIKKERRYLKNYNSDRYLFRIFHNPNTKRPEGCSANKILRHKDGIVYAIHCNCGKYHPVFVITEGSKRHEVGWSIKIESKDEFSIDKDIKKLWITAV